MSLRSDGRKNLCQSTVINIAATAREHSDILIVKEYPMFAKFWWLGKLNLLYGREIADEPGIGSFQVLIYIRGAFRARMFLRRGDYNSYMGRHQFILKLSY